MYRKLLSLSFSICIALAGASCAGTESDTNDNGNDTNESGNGGGVCTEQCAATPEACPFAAPIDCTTACANIRAVCASDCTSCDGVDTTNCEVGCLGAGQAVAASNVAYGCYATNDTCAGVGTCFQQHCPTQ